MLTKFWTGCTESLLASRRDCDSFSSVKFGPEKVYVIVQKIHEFEFL